MTATRLAPAATERYPAESCRERWLERLELEHETVAAVESVAREGTEIRVRREGRGGAGIASASVPRRARPPLLLQAASAAAFYAAHGFPLSAGELEAARWDGEGAAVRLWIPRRLDAIEAETPPA